MKKIIPLLVALPLTSFAQQHNWELQMDTYLNGELTHASVNTHQMEIEMYSHIITGKLLSLTKLHTLSGELETLPIAQVEPQTTQRIQFTLADGETRKYFLGQGALATGFHGTWFGPNNDSGDFRLATEQQQPSIPLHCANILEQNPSSESGVYMIDPDGGNVDNAFNAYCDMTTDDGGWTLIGTFPKSQTGGFAYINEYNDTPDITPLDPSHTGLYQGSLSSFKDVREQVACHSGNCQTAYQISSTTAELEMIRYSWGYVDQQEKQLLGYVLPNCTTDYNSTTVYEQCLFASDRNNSNVVGWQRDVNGEHHSCWLGHGLHKPSSQGSSQCLYNAQGNGTKWGLLWVR